MRALVPMHLWRWMVRALTNISCANCGAVRVSPRLLEHVYHGNGASSVFVVATVRGYNSVGVYSEACSDGTRLMVAECVALSESDDASLPRNTLRKFLCGQHRDFLCMPVQTYNPSVTN